MRRRLVTSLLLILAVASVAAPASVVGEALLAIGRFPPGSDIAPIARWAGLDTGRPGYTRGITPQPHNEGNFTALGRVVHGMDVVERLQLGDTITGARMLK